MEVVEYDEQRWEDLLKFFRVMNLGFAREPDVFRWKYLQSPAARRGVSQFLTVIDEGKIAGTLGFTECPVYVHGKKLMSCAFNDWYILPRLRGKGMGDKLIPYFTNRPAEIKLHFLSSPPSIKAALRHGFDRLRGIADLVEHLAPMRSTVQCAWRKVTRHRCRRRPKMKPHLKRLERLDPCVKVLDADDSQINELLTRCQLQYPFACARDIEYLRWRYLEHPKDLGVLLQLNCESGGPQAVFALVWRCTGVRDTLLLADVYYNRQRPEDLRRILQFHRQAALAMGANARSIYTGNSELSHAAKASGMTHITERVNGIYNGSDMPLDTGKVSEWYTSGGDSDYVS
ncbi:GNAT family N-acetyltransferase [bacterium]|nr:GNAT family N-acetyltransferase [bacterium]